MKTILSFLTALILIPFISFSQDDRPDWIAGYPDACTSITAGRLATVDGSVITSHTDDSHRTRSWINIVPAKDHKEDETVKMYKRVACDTFAMPTYSHNVIGEIPQVAHTYGYINTAYPSLNEKQLGIGESTFGGRPELQSDNGLIDCQRLCQLMLERCTTAREAIIMADELTKEYGWNDAGEALTIADKNEVWHFEIVGPGKGKKGAVWVAQRVPDDHIAVNANASTIKEIDLTNPDYFMASENIFDVGDLPCRTEHMIIIKSKCIIQISVTPLFNSFVRNSKVNKLFQSLFPDSRNFSCVVADDVFPVLPGEPDNFIFKRCLFYRRFHELIILILMVIKKMLLIL
jgi:hypothetical protein